MISHPSWYLSQNSLIKSVRKSEADTAPLSLAKHALKCIIIKLTVNI